MILTIDQTKEYAKQAGFTGQALATIVAIAQAESGLNTTAVNANDPNGGSFGILQINGVHHVPQSQAFDPAYSFKFAYQLSNGGSNFSPWSTYTSGKYKETSAWKQLSGSTSSSQPTQQSTWNPQKSRQLWPWLTKDGSTINASQGYKGSAHWGIDVPMNLHTPITSLTQGTVQAVFYGEEINPAYAYGGVVVVLSTIPGYQGMQLVYYLHLDIMKVKRGDIVIVGQTLALSGGQTSGGNHPVAPKFSEGPHTEIGINNPDFKAKTGPVGASIDPTQWILNLLKNGPGDQVGIAITPGEQTRSLANIQEISNQIATGNGPVNDSFIAIETKLDYGMELIVPTLNVGLDWTDYIMFWNIPKKLSNGIQEAGVIIAHDIMAILYRIMVVLIGFIIIILFVFHLINAITGPLVSTVAKAAMAGGEVA